MRRRQDPIGPFEGGQDNWDQGPGGQIVTAEFFAAQPAAPLNQGGVGVWNGTAFVPAPVMVWTGSSWAQKPAKRWSGTTWLLT